MEMYTKENLIMVKKKDKAFIYTVIKLNIREHGEMMKKMDKG